MSYSYSSNTYSGYSSYQPPKTRSSPPVWLIVVVIVFVAVFEYCKQICREEGEERARQRFELSQTRQIAPRVAIVSEMVHRPTRPSPVQFVSYTLIDEYDTAGARLGERLAQPLANRLLETSEESTPTRPPVRNDSVPQYEGPPNYEEALALLNVSQKQKDHDTPIT